MTEGKAEGIIPVSGEQGQYFVCVNEIERTDWYLVSYVAADDISKLTAELQNTVQKAAVHMESSVQEVQKNVGIVADAKEAFGTLYEKVDETNQRIAQMITVVGQVSQVAKQMEQIAGEQVQATEQIAGSTQQLEQYTRSVTTDSSTIAEEAEELKEKSRELMGRMKQFRI